MLTANSGELVPNATTVSPIMRGEIPRPDAMLDAPRTNISAPIISAANPRINSRIVMKVKKVKWFYDYESY
jgi:hypothetical protein